MVAVKFGTTYNINLLLLLCIQRWVSSVYVCDLECYNDNAYELKVAKVFFEDNQVLSKAYFSIQVIC